MAQQEQLLPIKTQKHKNNKTSSKPNNKPYQNVSNNNIIKKKGKNLRTPSFKTIKTCTHPKPSVKTQLSHSSRVKQFSDDCRNTNEIIIDFDKISLIPLTLNNDRDYQTMNDSQTSHKIRHIKMAPPAQNLKWHKQN